MKAERRHELKTNSLSKGMESAPAFFQQYGSRIMLAVIVCLLVYIVVKNHVRSNEEKAANAAKALGGALYSLNQMRDIPFRTQQGQMASPEQIVTLRNDYARDVQTALDEVMANSDDPKILAQAWVAKGDLNWRLATFPEIPGAATQPALKPEKPMDDYLTAAAEAYNKVLAPPLDADHQSVVSARLSLGYVAEDRGQWDKAKDYFQQVADDASAGKGFQDWAKRVIEEIKTLDKPVFTGGGEAPPPSFEPTTAPATSAPAVGIPTTARTTRPSPTTAPASTEPSIFAPTKDPLRLK